MGDMTSKTRPNRVEMECDDLDYEVIQRAIAIRQQSVMPDHGSTTTGAVIAEICRGWLEAQGLPIRSESEEQ